MIETRQLTDSIISSCAEIIEMMLPMALSDKMSQRPLPLGTDLKDYNDEIIVSIGLTGDYSGTMSLYLSLELALKMASWMMEEDYQELNSEVCESVGEVLNMIAGGVKNRLSTDEYDVFDISLPITISGRDKHLFHGKDKTPLVVPIDTDKGIFAVTLVLEQK